MSETMTPIERLTAVMTGGIPDRVPIMGNLLEQGADALGLSIETYYSKGEYVAEGQLKLREKYGYDNLSGFFYAGREAEILGCRRIIFSEHGPPNVGHLIIKDHRDIESLTVPDNISQHPGFRELAACIRILKQEAGGKVPVGSSVTSSFSLPAILMGIDRWMDLMLNGPEPVRDTLLKKCSDFAIGLARALREAGADGISYSNPVGSADFLTLGQFRNLSLPWVKRDIDGIGIEGTTYFNGGGRINPMLEDLITETGIMVYYINPMDDVTEAAKIIGSRGISSGVINDIPLVDWTKEQIFKEVRRIMEAGAADGRFIFGTLVMPYLIPEENIRHLFDAAREYGAYA